MQDRAFTVSGMQQVQNFHDTDHVKTAIRDAWTAAWDQGEVDALDALAASDYQRISTQSGEASGLSAVKDEILEIRSALPDLTTTVERILIEGDQAAIYWNATGTFTQPLNGVPATGRSVTTHGSNLVTFQDGLILREEVTWDARALLSDLGLNSLKSAFETHDVETVTDNLSGQPVREALKAFNRQFITGVTVITTVDEDGTPRGLAANSYNSISLDPPLVLVCVMKSSSTYPALFRSQYMGINIMSSDQRDTLGVFASKTPDKFSQVTWHHGQFGSPLIDDSAACVEVEIKERFQAMTHTVFVGRVRSSEATDVDPIIYKAGQFFDGRDLTPLD